MDQAEITMITNLLKNTGKSLEEWISIVKSKNIGKHGQIISFLKEEHAFTHGFANLVAHKTLGSDAGSVENKDELIENQYKGKEHFRPVYEKLMSEISKFGSDIEIAPKNAYVSLRRKKQFAILQPATKTRFEIGVIIKDQQAEGILEIINTPNAMCSHRINITSENEITEEVINWIKISYEKAL